MERRPDRNPRIPVLMEMLKELSRAATPEESFRAFMSRFWKVRPIDFFLGLSVAGRGPGEFVITYLIDARDIADGKTSVLTRSRTPEEIAALPAHREGFLASVVRNVAPQFYGDLELSNDPVLGENMGAMRCAMAMPVFERGEPIEWSLVFSRSADAFSGEDVELALLVTNLLTATGRQLHLLSHIGRLNNRLTAQLEEVARLQQALLPSRIPAIPGLTIATSYLTSDEAGGDYYDFFPLPDERWGILISDVSGHGAGAAAVMAMLHAILHAYPDMDDGPAAVMRYANNRLHAASLETGFVTAFFAIYDPRSDSLTYSRAGHPPPRRKVGADGPVRALEGAAGLPLGITQDYRITEESTVIEPGETVILYTDGITESFSPERRMFDVTGLDAALATCSGEPDCVVDTVHSALYKHTGLRTRSDDQTLVVFRRTGAGP